MLFIWPQCTQIPLFTEWIVLQGKPPIFFISSSGNRFSIWIHFLFWFYFIVLVLVLVLHVLSFLTQFRSSTHDALQFNPTHLSELVLSKCMETIFNTQYSSISQATGSLGGDTDPPDTTESQSQTRRMGSLER